MYTAKETRYNTMRYFRCGKSGLKLPGVSLGFWHRPDCSDVLLGTWG
jgi:L-glyceraldehyde 3-phosphate reductase